MKDIKQYKIDKLVSCHLDRIEMCQETIEDALKALYSRFEDSELDSEYDFYFCEVEA